MSRWSLSLIAAMLALFGAAVLTGHPPWGAVIGITILLTGAAMAACALTGKSSPEAQASGQKIPASLVTLSATAILAVYVAGYQRTRASADQFEAQTARRQSSVPTVAVVAPRPLEPSVTAPPVVQTPVAPVRKPAITGRPAATIPDAAPKPAAAPELPAAAVAVPAPVNEPPAEPVAAPLAKADPLHSYKDGTFVGWGRCRHGSIQASVAIEGGQIIATEITQCLTRYSCSWISNLPGQVITRQSAKVDYVSGATESTDAFYDAVSSALAAARE